MVRNLDSVCDRTVSKHAFSSSKNPLILPSSGSRRSKSGKTIGPVSSSEKRDGCSGGGFRIACHAFFSSCSLIESQFSACLGIFRPSYLLTLISNWASFSSSSMFLGLGFNTTGALGASSSLLNQSENSDRAAKSLSSWS
jgi:hypothetical protein